MAPKYSSAGSTGSQKYSFTVLPGEDHETIYRPDIFLILTGILFTSHLACKICLVFLRSSLDMSEVLLLDIPCCYSKTVNNRIVGGANNEYRGGPRGPGTGFVRSWG